MKKFIFILLVFQSFYSAGQGEVKKAFRLEHHLGEKKPKIIFPGEFIQYKKLKSHSLEEGVIKEVTDTSLVFTNFVEVKFDELKYIRKHSIFKGELGIGLEIIVKTGNIRWIAILLMINLADR